jgi:hypothetical protein
MARYLYLTFAIVLTLQSLDMNVSATFNIFRLIANPTLCLPHATISNFNQLPIPVSEAFASGERSPPPDIRAVVLDKDNCFAIPQQSSVFKDYEVGGNQAVWSWCGSRKVMPRLALNPPPRSDPCQRCYGCFVRLTSRIGKIPSATSGISRVSSPNSQQLCRNRRRPVRQRCR